MGTTALPKIVITARIANNPLTDD